MEKSTPVITTENLGIGYQKKRNSNRIASGINMQINPGELVAVIGINGIGKSTLLKSLSGIQQPLEGKIFFNGKESKQLNALELASTISLVLTGQPISKNLSVFELVALGRQPYTNWVGKLGENDLLQIASALKMVQIEALQHKKCYELSDGQLQKVLIARAISQDTPLVILDEPTTHLDLYHKAYVLKLLKELTRKTHKAILFASHEINLAIQLCDKIILMQPGSLEMDTPQKLLETGSFDKIFPPDTIIFDAESRSFQIKS